LLEELGLDKDLEGKIESPIMHFQFHDDRRIADFSNQPIATNFMKLAENTEKKKWLQKCLLVGLPIFQYVQFKKLGYIVGSIL
jgi:hypothetical protein